jgi:Fe2+ transport system protein B
MSQQQDPNTEELLMLLLESMKEYRGAINDDRKRLEQFYKSVDKNIVQEFNNALNRSKSGIDANFSDSLSKAHARLQQSANLLDEKTKVLNQTTNRLDRNFDNRFILLYSAIFIGLVALVVMFLHFFVPSWDEIKQRRQLAEHYNLDLQMCTVDNTAKPCVRVMKKLCNYGENHDLCVIDPK